MTELKVLVVGLGSMGKRRVRNFKALGVRDILGFDLREDRRKEAHEKYGIATFADFESAVAERPDAVAISLPPDLHTPFALRAAEADIPFFTEASVVSRDMDKLIEVVRRKGLVAFPSCTMRYFPGPKRVKELVRSGAVGRPLTWTYHSGQYLPDWHPWESIHDFYVSKRETGGAREIVPFELTWLTELFGPVQHVAAEVEKVSDLPVDIDDVYRIELAHAGGPRGFLQVDVVARPAVRHLRVLGTEGTLEWDGPRKSIRLWTAKRGDWEDIPLVAGTTEAGYINPEEPYVEEMRDFLHAVQTREAPRYSLEEDLDVLRLLEAAEESGRRGERVAYQPEART